MAKTKKPRVQDANINIKIASGILAAGQRLAQEKGVTFSEWLRSLIEQAIQADELLLNEQNDPGGEIRRLAREAIHDKNPHLELAGGSMRNT